MPSAPGNRTPCEDRLPAIQSKPRVKAEADKNVSLDYSVIWTPGIFGLRKEENIIKANSVTPCIPAQCLQLTYTHTVSFGTEKILIPILQMRKVDSES